MSTEKTTEQASEPEKPQPNYIKTRDDVDIVKFETSENDKFR